MDFFRHCPNCGRRFHIVLEDKKLVSMDREPVTIKPTGPASEDNMVRKYASEQIILEIQEYQYKYKCKNCGHEWIEQRKEERRE